jgi:hypothetical protein
VYSYENNAENELPSGTHTCFYKVNFGENFLYKTYTAKKRENPLLFSVEIWSTVDPNIARKLVHLHWHLFHGLLDNEPLLT